jgi:hypothetical protein
MENIERREKRNSGKESIYKVIRDFVNYKPGIECYDELIHIIGIRPMILHPKTKKEILINYILKMKLLVDRNEIDKLEAMSSIMDKRNSLRYNLLDDEVD